MRNHSRPSRLEPVGAFAEGFVLMLRVVKRPVEATIKTNQRRRRQVATLALPNWIRPQLCQPVENARHATRSNNPIGEHRVYCDRCLFTFLKACYLLLVVSSSSLRLLSCLRNS